MRVLLAALGLLAFATSASAECAWVLWEETERTDARFNSQTSWAVQVARPMRQECEEVLSRTWEVEAKTWKSRVKDTRAVRGLVIVNFDRTAGEYAGGFTKKFVCLPDTVDPRGPKTK